MRLMFTEKVGTKETGFLLFSDLLRVEQDDSKSQARVLPTFLSGREWADEEVITYNYE